MPLILIIDTATENASVALCNNLEVIAFETNSIQNSHASFLQPAIEKIMHVSGFSLQQVDAIAVTNGPGSYTGLRVGLASAKGLCFALQKPLITLSTLEVMAIASFNETDGVDTLYCPMIDARRMEVFTAVYNKELIEILKPTALVLDDNSFGDILATHKVIYSGSGAAKTSEIIKHNNAVFLDISHNVSNAAALCLSKFNKTDFTSIAYATPNYLKAFYTTAKTVS